MQRGRGPPRERMKALWQKDIGNGVGEANYLEGGDRDGAWQRPNWLRMKEVSGEAALCHCGREYAAHMMRNSYGQGITWAAQDNVFRKATRVVLLPFFLQVSHRQIRRETKTCWTASLSDGRTSFETRCSLNMRKRRDLEHLTIKWSSGRRSSAAGWLEQWVCEIESNLRMFR